MNPLISIIIPVYNVQDYLRECLDSVCGQTYRNIEIILIDDGSTDDSGNICDEYAQKDSRIIVNHKNNDGVSKARNNGMDIAKGKYISFVDSDDWIDRCYCEVLLNKAVALAADIVACSLIGEDGTNKCTVDGLTDSSGEMRRVNLVDEKFEFFRWYSINGPFCKLFKRDLVEKIRFDESLCVGEDLVFYIQALKNAKLCEAIAFPLYHYRIREGSAMHVKDIPHLYSEIIAWDKVCNMLNKEWKSYERASEKLLFYTFRLLKLVYKNNYQISKQQMRNLRRICREKKRFSYILGTGVRFKMVYPLLMITPKLFFSLN